MPDTIDTTTLSAADLVSLIAVLGKGPIPWHVRRALTHKLAKMLAAIPPEPETDPPRGPTKFIHEWPPEGENG